MIYLKENPKRTKLKVWIKRNELGLVTDIEEDPRDEYISHYAETDRMIPRTRYDWNLRKTVPDGERPETVPVKVKRSETGWERVDNFIFTGVFEITGKYGGASTDWINLQNEGTNINVNMSTRQFIEIVKVANSNNSNFSLVGGFLSGKFTFYKQGSAFGIKPVFED